MMILSLAIALLSPQDPKEKSNDLPSLVEVFRFTERGVVGLDFPATGTTLAIGGDGYVGILDLRTFKIVKQVEQKDLVDEVLFDPQGPRLISRSKSPDTVIRMLGDLEPIKFSVDVPVSEGPMDPNRPLTPDVASSGCAGSCPAAFSRDGKRLALVNGRRGFKVWGLEGLAGDRMAVLELNFESLPIRKPKKSEDDEFNRIPSVPHVMLNHATALCYEGDCLWVGMEDGFVMPVDPDLFKPLGEPKSDKPPANFSVTGPQYLRLRDANVFRPHSGDVTSIVFLPGDRTFMTAGREGLVGIWSTREVLNRKLPVSDLDKPREPKPVKILNGHFACQSPDGRLIAVAEKNGVRCYDRESFAPVSWTPTDPKLGIPTRVKFSRDGSMLAATICACPTCSKANVLYTQAVLPKMRSHHHGGALIVWNTAATPTK